MFHAQFTPTDSNDARWVLADALSQQAGIIDGLNVEEFQEEFGKELTRLSALMVAVILERSDGEGVFERFLMGMWLGDAAEGDFVLPQSA